MKILCRFESDYVHEEKRYANTNVVATLISDGHEVYVDKRVDNFKKFISLGAKEIPNLDSFKGEKLGVLQVKQITDKQLDEISASLNPSEVSIFGFLHPLSPENESTIKRAQEMGLGLYSYDLLVDNGGRPLLAPMSVIAGELAIDLSVQKMREDHVLFGEDTKVVVIGGGVVGSNSLKRAVGLGGKVVVYEINSEKNNYLLSLGAKEIQNNLSSLANDVLDADVVVSSVASVGKKAEVVVSDEMIKSSKPECLFVDISIDEGGSIGSGEIEAKFGTNVWDKVQGRDILRGANLPSMVYKTASEKLFNAVTPYATRLFKLIENDQQLDEVLKSSQV